MATGALVAAGGSVFISPGRKNEAGETDAPVLMPEQPALASVKNTSIASHGKFHFNLTCPV
jgi:hypothetical protein